MKTMKTMKQSMKALVTAAVLGFATEGVAGATDFRYQSVIAVQGFDSAAELADFPVLVRVSPERIEGFDYADVAAGGSDLRFYDAEGTLLPCEIDTWNPDGESLVWVKLPALTQDVSFTMRWSPKTTPDANDPTAVWSAYAGVWHMNEPSGDVADATGHGLTATPMGNTDNSVAVTGATVPTGTARQSATSAAKGYLSVPNYNSLALGSGFTIMGWVKMNGTSGYPRLFSRKDNYQSNNGWEVEMGSGSYNSMTVRGASNSPTFNATVASLNNAWAHVAVAYNGGKAEVFSNGKSVKSDGGVTAATDNGLPLSFGCNSNGSESYLFATFDEVRLYAGAADKVRMAAEYATVNDANYLVCSPRELVLPFALTTPQVAFDAPKNQYTLTFSLTKGEADLLAVVSDGAGNELTTTVAEGATPGEYVAVVSKLTPSATVRLGVRGQASGLSGDWFAPGEYVNRTAFGKCADVAVGGYTADETLVNFPVCVRLGSSEGFAWDDAGANGSQIRFVAANGRILAHEVESWPADTTAEDAAAVVWVNVPALARGTTFAMYWQSAAAAAKSVDAGGAWASYVGVWHMNEPSGEPVADATGHGLAGEPKGAVAESILLTDGVPTGAGRQVCDSATASAIVVPNYDTFALGGRFTLSGWVKMYSGCSNYPRLFSRKEKHTDAGGWEIESQSASPTTFTCRGSKNDKNFNVTLPSLQTAWRHVVFSYNDNVLDVYADGAFVKIGGVIDAAYDNGLPLGFGNNSILGNSAFRGAFDEMRLKRGPASAAWAKAEYDSVVNAGFSSVGAATEILPADMCQVGAAEIVRDGADYAVRFTVVTGEGDVSVIVKDVAAGTLTTNLFASGVGPGTYTAAIGGLADGKEYAISVLAQTGSLEMTTPAGTIYTGEITVTAGDAADLGQLQAGSFTVSLPDGVTLENDLVILLSFGGTAVPGGDYVQLPSQVVIPAGEGSVTVTVAPKWNADAADATAVEVALAPGGYVVPQAGASASVAISPCAHRWGLLNGQIVEHELVGTPWKFAATANDDGVTMGAIEQTGSSRALDFNDCDADLVITEMKGPFHKMTLASADSIMLPATLRKIQNTYAFDSCEPTITIPPENALESIPYYCFGKANLKGDVVLPAVTFVDQYAFYQCTALTSLTYGEGLRNIKQDSLKELGNSFTNFVLLGAVTNIEQWAIHGARGLKQWTYSSYPNFTAKWCGDNDTYILQGTGVRAFVPMTDQGWKDVVADALVFTPWASCTDTQRDQYFAAFGNGAEEPLGYTTRPMKMWLMRKPVVVTDKPHLAVAGVPFEYDPADVSPTYGDYRDIEADDLPMHLSAPRYFHDGKVLRETTGYTFETFDPESGDWADGTTVAEHSFTYDPEGAPYNRLTWNWVEAGYLIDLGVKPGVAVVTNAADQLEGDYWRTGSTASFTAVGANFKRWYGDIDTAQLTSPTVTLTVDGPKRLVPYFATPWTYDPTAGTITDGYWTFGVTAEGKELTIAKMKTVNPHHVVIDFTKPVEGGYEIVDILNGPDHSNLEDRPIDFTDELLLPKTLRRLHGWALYGFMPPVVLPPDNLITNIGGKAFSSENDTKRCGLCGDIVLNKIERLENEGIYRCPNVTSLTLGKNLEEYPSVYQGTQHDAAGHMTGMTNLVVKGAIKTLGIYAFCHNTVLSELHWASYPETCLTLASDGKSYWCANNKSGTDVRMFVPRGNEAWDSILASDAVTPWKDCTPAQQDAYFTAFGPNARKPVGYTASLPMPVPVSSSFACWLLYEQNSGMILFLR